LLAREQSGDISTWLTCGETVVRAPSGTRGETPWKITV